MRAIKIGDSSKILDGPKWTGRRPKRARPNLSGTVLLRAWVRPEYGCGFLLTFYIDCMCIAINVTRSEAAIAGMPFYHHPRYSEDFFISAA